VTQRKDAEQQLAALQLEYVQTQARKYKLMSKRKHHSQQGDGFKLEEELLKLTKSKAV